MVDGWVTSRSADAPLVLLVDDDEDSLELFAWSLTARGFAVAAARDGEEALRSVTEKIPDAVVSDILLPGMDGFTLCRELKRDARTAHIPVVAVSGYSAPSRDEEARSAGFESFLLKPCSPDRLLDEIRRVIARTRALRAVNRELRATSEALRSATREVCDRLTETMERLTRDRGAGS